MKHLVVIRILTTMKHPPSYEIWNKILPPPKKKIQPNQVKSLDLSTSVQKIQRAEESTKWPYGDVISNFQDEGNLTGQKAKIFQKITCKKKKKKE